MECKVRDLNIYYEEVGSGRPILMLHGWPADHRHMVSNLEPLFQKRDGWRRLYLDLPGMGKTRGSDWITHQDHMLEVVLEFIDKLAPGERFVVVGASYGGYLARGLVYRRREQIDGLLINVPVIETDPTKEHLPEHQVLHEDPEFLAALRPDEQELPDRVVVQSVKWLEAYRALIQPAVAVADHPFLERLTANFAFTFDVDNLPEPCPAPTLILTGRQDHWCGYREAWKLLDNYPRSTFVVLDRAGHGLVLDQATLFRALVSEWLDRVEEYAEKNAGSSA